MILLISELIFKRIYTHLHTYGSSYNTYFLIREGKITKMTLFKLLYLIILCHHYFVSNCFEFVFWFWRLHSRTVLTYRTQLPYYILFKEFQNSQKHQELDIYNIFHIFEAEASFKNDKHSCNKINLREVCLLLSIKSC